MHFTRLHLHGFKSFVDATDLPIGAGLTGIVGPNGCGKSNLVEALRWVMGENSARRMRGAGMEDVIFAGTATRPARNLAEVSLAMDNCDRSATAEFNNEDELLITRKIERSNGSDYRLNGKPLRQRDVQLIFADQSTGAASTSVVGQGQIDALIRAKPKDRRQILEEAAGTAGLQARRHEAELKLKGAEQNLTRVDDVLQTLDTQLRNLKQQVRQASRYRNLAEHIRKTEAGLLHLKWVEAEGNASNTRQALQAAESHANELLAIVTQSTTSRTEIAAELPALREAEAAAAAIVQKLTLAREQIDDEAKRTEANIRATNQRMTQAKDDLAREETHHKDSQEALARLSGERTELQTRVKEIDETLPSLTKLLDESTAQVTKLDDSLNDLMSRAADATARAQALTREMENLQKQKEALLTRQSNLEASRDSLKKELASRHDLSLTKALVEACEKELERRKQQVEEAEQARNDAATAQNEARQAATETENVLLKLRAEADAIQKLLAHDESMNDKLIDLVSVTPGLEKAFAVALGEALSASLDNNAAMHWRDLGSLQNPPALPAGIEALNRAVKAPQALQRALSQIGLVEDRSTGEAASKDLAAGQILVSRDGWAWRWDGFTLSPEAQTAAALRLEQKNRLNSLQEAIEKAATAHEAAMGKRAEADSLFAECQSLDKQTRDALNAAYAALTDARDTLSKQEREQAEANSKMNALEDNLREVTHNIDMLLVRAAAVTQEQTDLPNIEALQTQINSNRITLAESREKRAKQQSDCNNATQEKTRIQNRLTAIETDLKAWQDRMASAATQSQTLHKRIEELETEHLRLQELPAQLDEKRGTLMTQLEEAEKNRREASDILIATEQKLSVVEHKLKTDEGALSAAREARVRAEAAVEAADEHLTVLQERMEEKLSCGPEKLAEIAAFKDEEELPQLYELEQTLARHVRERDNMGPVNLRAEVESKAAEEEIQKLTKEKEDLTAAIAKLRKGISQLNHEARERLNGAFDKVNERFQKLFTTLFGGGTAYLELIDDDDPINAGLEIVAAPPGKKQQILSLLSGGERTLTALALLFSVFQTNPSPICVLDEAEAALDESNIGRFCELVQKIGKETGTRFLIITHQRLTMAHMDRLFGVTMSEKGVSQLVSVDLAGAVALRDGEEIEEMETTALETMKEVQAA
ncbi:MAG: chromosome segregation protein SMC [Bdellovibrionales bacterium]